MQVAERFHTLMPESGKKADLMNQLTSNELDR
jgi:hypothetical protein